MRKVIKVLQNQNIISRTLGMPERTEEINDLVEGHSSLLRTECPSAPRVRAKLMPSGKTQSNFVPPSQHQNHPEFGTPIQPYLGI